MDKLIFKYGQREVHALLVNSYQQNGVRHTEVVSQESLLNQDLIFYDVMFPDGSLGQMCAITERLVYGSFITTLRG